ncbi:unnamed protein product [Closterium sp. NIES-54]
MVPLLICLLCLMGGCMWWLFRRCLHSGSTASKDWPPATYDEFKDVPRICRILLSVYEEDINNPVYNDRLVIKDVVRLAGYKDTQGRCPPYVIYVDHAARDICLAVRGLNMGNFADYRVLMDNRIGKQRFDGGYVHHGLLKSAAWLLDQEMETLNALAAENPEYTVTLAGHSLGSGIVAMMTVILHKNPGEVGFDNARLRCFCIAPARSTSLNLAIKYADIINSVVLQDDFLPRTSAPIDNILALSFCLPCMLCLKCCWDTCGLYKWRVKDPRRLYAPGRLFHILYTSDFSVLVPIRPDTIVGAVRVCKYCAIEFKGGAFRCAQHLAKWKGQRSRDVRLCAKVPPYVRAAVREHYEKKAANRDKKRQAEDAALDAVVGGAKKGCITDFIGDEAQCKKGEADNSVCLFFAGCRIPKHHTDNLLWRNMVRAINNAPHGYVAPRRNYVGGAGLKQCRTGIEKRLQPIAASWKRDGVTVSSDLMTDRCGRPQANLMLVNDSGAVFVEAMDCKME